jgi:hypothetical protein
MNDLLIDSVILINRFFSLTVGTSLHFISVFPYWISLSLVSGLAGLVFIPVFKYFSNQRAVSMARDMIAADLLAIRIFKDNPAVMIRAQGRIFIASLRLLWYTLPSLLIMILPVSFLLTQMSGWYQFRPLQIGEPAMVIVKTHFDRDQPLSDIHLETPAGLEILAGPVRIETQNELVWKIVGLGNGSYPLYFRISGGVITKKLAVGHNSFPVSIRIPERALGEVLLYPSEPPPAKGMVIRSISVTYGDPFVDPLARFDWLVVFSLVSLLVFLVFKRFFRVVV